MGSMDELPAIVARLDATMKAIESRLVSLGQDINATSKSSEEGRDEVRALRRDFDFLKHDFDRMAKEDMQTLREAVRENGNFKTEWQRTKSVWIAIGSVMLGIGGLLSTPYGQAALALIFGLKQ